jgi:hypothetical protein
MDRSLLSLRSTLVLLLAVLTGVGAGVLTKLAGDGTARSLLYGLAAAAAAVPFFDRLVAVDDLGDRRGGGTQPGGRPHQGVAGARDRGTGDGRG